MGWLGYDSWQSFQGVITKAMGSCTRLGLDPTDAFVREEVIEGGRTIRTYRLTRFACLLVSMTADSKKPEVAEAKAALAAIADTLIQQHVESADLARLETREDLKIAEKTMTGAARDGGLQTTEFGIFKDAGFRGMYNMSLRDLQAHKGMPQGKTLYDFMGLEELAGNLFRVTQTAARIKSKNVSGLNSLQRTARDVGSEVRRMMIQNSDTAPEHLAIEEDVHGVQKRLKKVDREMKKLDKPKAKKKT
jgi:DNA-damage-inducible protein D